MFDLPPKNTAAAHGFGCFGWECASSWDQQYHHSAAVASSTHMQAATFSSRTLSPHAPQPPHSVTPVGHSSPPLSSKHVATKVPQHVRGQIRQENYFRPQTSGRGQQSQPNNSKQHLPNANQMFRPPPKSLSAHGKHSSQGGYVEAPKKKSRAPHQFSGGGPSVTFDLTLGSAEDEFDYDAPALFTEPKKKSVQAGWGSQAPKRSTSSGNKAALPLVFRHK